MSRRLEILVEEHSMEAFLVGLLPRILPDGFKVGENCFIHPHEGKNDLQKHLPKRVRAYRNYPETILLIIIQDQDYSNCKVLKRKLIELVGQSNRELNLLVRIACRELENWYLGDLAAVEEVYPHSKATKNTNKAKYKNVDDIKGSDEMRRLSKEFSKMACARRIGTIIKIERNKSNSFNQFINGLNNFLC